MLLRRQREEYGKFSKAAGLLTQNDRTQVYGYDRSKSAKTVWAERKAQTTSGSSVAVSGGSSGGTGTVYSSIQNPQTGTVMNYYTPNNFSQNLSNALTNNSGNGKIHSRGHITLSDGESIAEYISNELGVDLSTATDMADCIADFSYESFPEVRAYQRGELKGNTQEISKQATIIENYIRKAPKWNGGTTHRGISVSDEEIKKYEIGSQISMGGTSSWSSNNDTALQYAKRNATNGKSNQVVFHCNTQSKGTSIRHISVFQDEDEVLCSSDSSYIIEKIEKNNNVTHVYLKEA